MAYKSWILLCLGIVLSFAVPAQTLIPLPLTLFQGSDRLEVTLNKTTHLVFPGTILSVDRGSTDILVQKAAGVDHILRIKAGKKDFEETSLSVITGDGRLYTFLITYTPSPAYLNLKISAAHWSAHDSVEKPPAAFWPMDAAVFPPYAQRTPMAKSHQQKLRVRKDQMDLLFDGIYTKQDLLFCRLRLQNKSAIGYEIQQLRFYLKDRKTGKRTAYQEVELKPLFVNIGTGRVQGGQSLDLLVALPKFTVPSKQYLVVEILEKGGSRHIQLKVNKRRILRAEAWEG